MEDQAPDPNSPSHGSERSERVRSRWTPKPEQILILESIFNSDVQGLAANNDNCRLALQRNIEITKHNYLLVVQFIGSSSSCGVMGDDGMENLLSMSALMGFQEIGQSSSDTSVLCPSETSNLHYQSGFITVFINGVPTEVPRGPLDMKAMFSQDVVLVHSSGVPVPTNEFCFSLESLQPGESYFLVSRTT